MKEKKVKKTSISGIIAIAVVAVIVIALSFAWPAIMNAAGTAGKRGDYYRFDNNGISYKLERDKKIIDITVPYHFEFYKMILVEKDDEKVPTFEIAGEMYKFYTENQAKKMFEGISNVVNEMNGFVDGTYDEKVIIRVNEYLFLIHNASNQELVNKILPNGDKQIIGEFKS